MICPNCHLQQSDHAPFCARCHYPFRSQSQGFFTKTSQGYSRADAYVAMQRGGYPTQPPPVPPVQTVPGYSQNQYYVPPQSSYQNSNQNSVRMMYDAAGNPVYVQIVYDAAGNPFYVQMIPKITGQDAHGNPIYTMIQANTPPIPVQHVQNPVQRPPVQTPAQNPYQNPFQNLARNAMYDSESASESENPASRTVSPASPFQASAQEVPPVPVLPSPDEMSPELEHPVPDRPAMRATAIAYSMYAANQEQPDAQNSTGSYFSRTRQNQNQNSDPTQELYEMPLSAEELLKEEAETAFVQEIPDEKTLLRQVFERQAGYYQENPEESEIGTIRIVVSAEEITSVSQRSLYQTSRKPPKAQVVTATPVPGKSEKNSSKNSEKKPEKPDSGNRLFGGKKQKEPKKKTVIVDADAFFGDSKRGRSVEMLGVRVDGTDEDVQRKLKEMRYGGKKSVRSMEAADKDLDLHAMIEDPQTSDAARRALEGEEAKKVYDSLESAEIAKALEQLNQGIFPKKF
ncbi:MAG: hypothetical protein K2H82_02340 [Oscillospiraceae bacterium]|nr:hypothetical protein [Oscillospiraceae bacterium]